MWHQFFFSSEIERYIINIKQSCQVSFTVWKTAIHFFFWLIIWAFHLFHIFYFTFNHNIQLKPMTLTFPHRCIVMRRSPHNHAEASRQLVTWCEPHFMNGVEGLVPVVQLVFLSDLLQHKSFWPLSTNQEVQIWMFATKLWDDPAK